MIKFISVELFLVTLIILVLPAFILYRKKPTGLLSYVMFALPILGYALFLLRYDSSLNTCFARWGQCWTATVFYGLELHDAAGWFIILPLLGSAIYVGTLYFENRNHPALKPINTYAQALLNLVWRYIQANPVQSLIVAGLFILLVTGVLEQLLGVLLVILILPFVIGFGLTLLGGEWETLGNDIMRMYWQILKLGIHRAKRLTKQKEEGWNYIYTNFQERFGYIGDTKAFIDGLRQKYPDIPDTPDRFIDKLVKEWGDGDKEWSEIGYQGVFNDDVKNFPVRLHTDRRIRHTWLTGVTGTGKSTLLHHLAYQDLMYHRGYLLITPRQQFIDEHIMPWSWVFHEKAAASPPLYFDATMENPLNWNPLLLTADHDFGTDKGPEGIKIIENLDAKASALVSMFREVMPAPGSIAGWTPRMEEVLEYALKAIIERRGTFLDVWPLVDIKNKELRQEIASTTKDPLVRDFWKDHFPTRYHEYKESIVALHVRLSRLLSHQGIRKMLCSYSGKDAPGRLYFRNTVPLTGVIGQDSQIIVNCSPSLGLDNAKMLGRLFTSAVQGSLAIQERQPETERQPFFIYLDEAQEFFFGSSQLLSYMLDASRQYKYGWTLATPPLRSENRQLQELLYSNSSTIVAFQLGMPHAREMASHMLTHKATPLAFIRDYLDWMKLTDEDGNPTADALRAREKIFELADKAGIDTHQPEELMIRQLEEKGAVFEREALDPQQLMTLPERGAYAKIGTAMEGGQWVVRMDVPPYRSLTELDEIGDHEDWRIGYAKWVEEYFPIVEEPPPPPQIVINDQTLKEYAGEPIQDIKIIYPFRD